MTIDTDAYLAALIEIAINEDVGDGDHSSNACIPEGKTGTAELIAKQDGIIAGIEIASRVFKSLDNTLQLTALKEDGDNVSKGDIVFRIQGKVHTILKGERLVLNIMQRMSGIATETKRYVQAIKNYKTKVLDTRKTAPSLRILDKLAVKTGGGENHRFGLYDMVMLKDNHIDYAGGIEAAIKKTNDYIHARHLSIKIEIEARNLEEVRQILSIGQVDRIMLDNFSIEETKEAVALIQGRFETESSGMINLETIQAYAACGVDYISVGSLTHKVNSLDLSLLAK